MSYITLLGFNLSTEESEKGEGKKHKMKMLSLFLVVLVVLVGHAASVSPGTNQRFKERGDAPSCGREVLPSTHRFCKYRKADLVNIVGRDDRTNDFVFAPTTGTVV